MPASYDRHTGHNPSLVNGLARLKGLPNMIDNTQTQTLMTISGGLTPNIPNPIIPKAKGKSLASRGLRLVVVAKPGLQESRTVTNARLSKTPMAYLAAVYAGSRMIRRDKSLEWADALQCASMVILQAGHNPCKPIPSDGKIKWPKGLMHAIKRELLLLASPENGLTRGRDAQSAKNRQATRKRLDSLAKRWRDNPMAIAAKALEYNLFPKANAFDIYRKLEDIAQLSGHDWRRFVSLATPKISAKGIPHLAEAPGSSPIKSTIWGNDGRGTVSHWEGGIGFTAR